MIFALFCTNNLNTFPLCYLNLYCDHYCITITDFMSKIKMMCCYVLVEIITWHFIFNKF